METRPDLLKQKPWGGLALCVSLAGRRLGPMLGRFHRAALWERDGAAGPAATSGPSDTQGRTPVTHVVPKFPEDGGEHAEGCFHSREAHLAEAGAEVTDDGHIHGAG